MNHPGEDAESLRATVDYFTAVRLEPPTHDGVCDGARFHVLARHGCRRRSRTPCEEFGTRIGHPQWWREAAFQGPLADDVRASRDELDPDAAVDELLRVRGATVMGMPVESKLLWRRLRAPLRAMFDAAEPRPGRLPGQD